MNRVFIPPIETCLHVLWHYISAFTPYIDLFLADLKHVDAEVFKQWTDGSAKTSGQPETPGGGRKNHHSRAADPGL